MSYLYFQNIPEINGTWCWFIRFIKKKKKKNHNTQQPIVYIEKNSTKQPSSWITQ